MNQRGPTPPVADADSTPFWAALREHRLEVQHCLSCGRKRFPPMPTCPYCAGRDAEWRPPEGVWRVYSWITVHRPLDPAFASEVPYTLAAVELPEGPRIVARLEGVGPHIDAEVEPRFHDHEGWTELRFRPYSSQS